jgi:DNA polymerase-3 subunit delta'
MLFSEVIGQSSLKKQLVHLVEQKRLSHALLFVGPEGAGALPLAIAFAQYIVSIPANNEGAGADLFGDASKTITANTFYTPDQIEDLPAYHRASKLMHPDLHFSFPSITEKPGQKNLSANFIEEWREFIMGYPYGNVYDWLQFIKAENKQGNISADECAEVIKKLSFKRLNRSGIVSKAKCIDY